MTRGRFKSLLRAALIVAGIAVTWSGAAHLARADDDDEDEKPVSVPERVLVVGGERVIVLDEAAQAQSGIVTAHPRRMRETTAPLVVGKVLDASALIELRRRYLRASESAPALANAIQSSARQRYERELAETFARPGPALAAVLSSKDALVEIAPGTGRKPPAALTASTPGGQQLALELLGAAPRPGHWLYAARGALRPGDTVAVRLEAGITHMGVLIPASAVVWHEGAPWVYVRREGRTFARIRLARATPERGGYWSAALTPRDEIVVEGAQLLLSEEFRARIHPEG